MIDTTISYNDQYELSLHRIPEKLFKQLFHKLRTFSETGLHNSGELNWFTINFGLTEIVFFSDFKVD